MKITLSLRQRARLIDELPKTGNLEKVEKLKKFRDELLPTEDELKVEKSINANTHEKEKKDAAINEWLDKEVDFEISNDLANFIKEIFQGKNSCGAFTVDDDVELIRKFI